MDRNQFADKVQKLMARHTQIEKDYINQIKEQQKQLDFYDSLLVIKIYKLIKRIIRR